MTPEKLAALGYRVTRTGLVYSVKNGARRLLRTYVNDNGYPSVFLYDGRGGRKHHPIYWLVARLYLPARPSGAHLVCHNNGRKRDSRACNLRWDTPSANLKDAWAHGARAFQRASGKRRAKYG